MSSNIRILKVCEHCHKEFMARTTVTKYCGDLCAKKAYKKRKTGAKLKSSTLSPADHIKQLHDRDDIKTIKEKEFLSVAEVCMLTGASKSTIYRLIREGKLKIHKLRRRTIIKRENLNYLIQ